VSKRDVDRALTGALQRGLGLSQEEEDARWARFESRRQEAVAWVAFGTAMAALAAGLRPALRAGGWRAGFHPRA
jgi:hypothetical protein